MTDQVKSFKLREKSETNQAKTRGPNAPRVPIKYRTGGCQTAFGGSRTSGRRYEAHVRLDRTGNEAVILQVFPLACHCSIYEAINKLADVLSRLQP
jgi:hypothetical protein